MKTQEYQMILARLCQLRHSYAVGANAKLEALILAGYCLSRIVFLGCDAAGTMAYEAAIEDLQQTIAALAAY